MKKTIISTMAALVLTCGFAFAGCGDNPSVPEEPSEQDNYNLVVAPLNVYTIDEEDVNIASSLDIASRIYLYDENESRIKDFVCTTELLSGSEYVDLENNVLKAKANGTASVNVSVTYDGQTWSKEKTVTVKSAYTQALITDFSVASEEASYVKAEEAVDGVENAYLFSAPDSASAAAWADCRITSNIIKKDNMAEFYREEYRYMSFKLRLGTSKYGYTQVCFWFGDFMGGWLDESHMPSMNYVKIIQDNKITQKVVHDEWVTVVLDMDQFYTCGTFADFNMCLNRGGASAYLADVRFWHTDEYLDCFEKAYDDYTPGETVKPPFWDDAEVDVYKAFVAPEGSTVQVSEKTEIDGRQAWKITLPEPTGKSVWTNRVEADLVSLSNAYEYDYLDIVVYVPSENNSFKGVFFEDTDGGSFGDWAYALDGWKASGSNRLIYDENDEKVDNLGHGVWRRIRFNLSDVTMKGYFAICMDWLTDVEGDAFFYISEMKFSKKIDPAGKVLGGDTGDNYADDIWGN